jgi:hypothetical protein
LLFGGGAAFLASGAVVYVYSSHKYARLSAWVAASAIGSAYAWYIYYTTPAYLEPSLESEKSRSYFRYAATTTVAAGAVGLAVSAPRTYANVQVLQKRSWFDGGKMRARRELVWYAGAFALCTFGAALLFLTRRKKDEPKVEGHRDRQRQQDLKREIVVGKVHVPGVKTDISHRSKDRIDFNSKIYKIYDGQAYSVIQRSQDPSSWGDETFSQVKTMYGKDITAGNCYISYKSKWLLVPNAINKNGVRVASFDKRELVLRADLMNEEKPKVTESPKDAPPTKEAERNSAGSSPQPKPSICKTCGASLPSKSALNKHKKVCKVEPVPTKLEGASVNPVLPVSDKVGKVYSYAGSVDGVKRYDPMHDFFVMKINSKVGLFLLKHGLIDHKIKMKYDGKMMKLSVPIQFRYCEKNSKSKALYESSEFEVLAEYGDAIFVNAESFGLPVLKTPFAQDLPAGSTVCLTMSDGRKGQGKMTSSLFQQEMCGVNMPAIKYDVSTMSGDCGAPWYILRKGLWTLGGFHSYNYKDSHLNGGIHLHSLNSLLSFTERGGEAHTNSPS